MNRTLAKFGSFAVIMVLLTAFLIVVFGQYRGGASNDYTAVFKDASSLRAGDTVRVSGIRVGTVKDVELQPTKDVVVTFDADRSVVLTSGTTAAVRYLNLIGDRYLELTDGPGQTKLLPPGAQIPVERTTPALDLDLLLGGLKPVIQGLNPQDVNALSASLIQIMQGQGGTVESLFSRTASFTNAIADNGEVVQRLIENLNLAMSTLAKDGDRFSATIDGLERIVTGLSQDREPIGTAIDSLSNGTASLVDLLSEARPPLAETVDQLNRLAPNLDVKKDRIDTALQKAPENYRKLVRLGAYGSFINYYICSIALRLSDTQSKTAEFEIFHQQGGRCAETA
ncbi:MULTISPECIES: MCE family protein [unclassified Mycobacterium]|uniref:MCE family protein n=1 Tax=unclassified Mycobacterium TaxID=2642494 RepID=UPI0029C69BE3|nr:MULTISPECIES: MCE family protein [unclassified Mycobacterium]